MPSGHEGSYCACAELVLHSDSRKIYNYVGTTPGASAELKRGARVGGIPWTTFSIRLSLRNRPVHCDPFKVFSFSLTTDNTGRDLLLSSHACLFSSWISQRGKTSVFPHTLLLITSVGISNLITFPNLGNESFVFYCHVTALWRWHHQRQAVIAWIGLSGIQPWVLASVKFETKNVDNCHRTKVGKPFFFPWIWGMFIGLLITPRSDAVCSLSSNHFWDPECSDSFSRCFPLYICVKWFYQKEWLGLPPLESRVSSPVKSTAWLLSLMRHAKKKVAMYVLPQKWLFYFATSRSSLVSSRRCCRENEEKQLIRKEN